MFVADNKLRKDAKTIIKRSIKAVLPHEAVQNALNLKLQNGGFKTGRIICISIGKAAYAMAEAADSILGNKIDSGIIITKYGHSQGHIPNFKCVEAGHPIPDDNSFLGTGAAIELVSALSENDTVLFLISGGGSALFEAPYISYAELSDITAKLLACGASIVEINTIRKRLSKVKGGKFAKLCHPAHIYSIILSDIIGDPLDMIASGPAYPDSSTCDDARKIIQKYNLNLSNEAFKYINTETPKEINNAETIVTGSVKQLCQAAAEVCKELGYAPTILTDRLDCEAKEAGAFLATIAVNHAHTQSPIAFIAGGETIVKLTGNGLGGRNQELALATAKYISNYNNICIFSLGSDGTDGPTDAAGGIVDGNTYTKLQALSIDTDEVLKQNDSYHALEKVNGLIITGPTGTNVNDVAVVLINPFEL